MPSRLIDLIQTQSWAIIPEKLDAIHQVVAAHAMGAANPEYPAMEAPEKPYQVIDRVAVIPIHGVIAKRMNMMMKISGGVSTELLARDITAAAEDADVRAIVLDVDSPGGTVDGTMELANLVRSVREVKPVAAFANGMMASAAYWIGSAASFIFAGETADVGSIGVVQAHYDYSKADEKAGVKRTFLHAGKYKTMGNDSEPLTEEGRAYLQDGLDYVYSLFVNAVAANRNMTTEEALAAADGKLFIGMQAMGAGLVDAIGNRNDAMQWAKDVGALTYVFGAKYGATAPNTKEAEIMAKEKTESPVTLDKLEAEAPGLVESIRAEGANSVDLEPAMAEGAKAEREKIMTLCAAFFGNDETEKFQKLITSGMTAEMYATAKELMAREEPAKPEASEKMGEMLHAIQQAGAQNPGAGAPANQPRNFKEAWQAIKEEKGCSTTAAMKMAVNQYPDLHKNYLRPVGNNA